MGQLWWIMDKKEKREKERKKPQWHHTRTGLHGCSQNPARGKGKNPHTDHNNGSPLMRFNHWFLSEVLITTMVAPWWDSTTDFSPRYQKKNQNVYLKVEIKLKLNVKTCCRLGYKGNSQPFDTVIWFINHIIVTILYMYAYMHIPPPPHTLLCLFFFPLFVTLLLLLLAMQITIAFAVFMQHNFQRVIGDSFGVSL